MRQIGTGCIMSLRCEIRQDRDSSYDIRRDKARQGEIRRDKAR